MGIPGFILGWLQVESFWKVLTWVPMSLRAHLNQSLAITPCLENLEDRKRLKLPVLTAGRESRMGRSGGCRGRPCPTAEGCNQREGSQQKVTVWVSLSGIEEVVDKG